MCPGGLQGEKEQASKGQQPTFDAAQQPRGGWKTSPDTVPCHHPTQTAPQAGGGWGRVCSREGMVGGRGEMGGV